MGMVDATNQHFYEWPSEPKPAAPVKDNYLDRDDAIKAIRAAFKARGFRFSVTGGKGTAWGWIHIDLLPADKKNKTPAQLDAKYRELNAALGEHDNCRSYIGVPASSEYRREYVDRAEGREPSVKGTPYWD